MDFYEIIKENTKGRGLIEFSFGKTVFADLFPQTPVFHGSRVEGEKF
jgi:hypothetical protein